MYLEFDVRHQTISRTDEFEVVANSLHYLFARFTFSEEWEGKQQTAIFSMNNGTNISVLLTDGECEVPWEVLRGREFWVGVFAGDRITSTPVRVPVQASVNLNASPGVQPTPSAYELLVQRVEDALKKGPYIGPNDNWWVWDATVNDFVDTGVYSHGSSPRIVNGVWWVGDTDTGVAATGPKGDKGDKGDTGNKGDKGDKGDPGNNIQAITRTAGTGAPGTTDTYTVTLTDGSTTTFSVYNGADGGGAGDMTATVYDPQGKKTDVFKAIEDAVAGLVTGAHASTHATGSSDPITPEMIGAAANHAFVTGVDLLEWAKAQTVGGTFFTNNDVTGVPVPGFWHGVLTLGAANGDKGLFIFNDTGAYCIATMARAFDTSVWQSIAYGDFLPLAGGILRGDLSLQKAANGSAHFFKNHTETADYGTEVRDINVGGAVAGISMNAEQQKIHAKFVNGGQTYLHELYHTGNLPVEAATAEIVE